MADLKTALISVSDKTGLIELAQNLAALNIHILSTGGTAEALKKAGIAVRMVSDITNFPEIMAGRVKTLHPKIHGGILGKRDEHAADAKEHGIKWIDFVIVNLYPFAKTVKAKAPYHEIIENIDIGGPAMIRAAAKNMQWVSVIVDPKDYQNFLDELKTNKEISLKTRKKLAAKAFSHTASYDAAIAQYLSEEKFPQHLALSFERFEVLRYGENPHQKAALYTHPIQTSSLLSAKQIQGKALSYNNLVDAEAALECVGEFEKPACVIVKHANPCGAAQAENINEAFKKAWASDSQSAFGGVVALNRICTKEIAEFLSAVFIELIIAPGFESEAADLLRSKPNCRVLDCHDKDHAKSDLSYKFIDAALLVQEKDHHSITAEDLKIVTKSKPSDKEIQDCLFAWKIVKHLKSNAILIVKDQASVGVGCGQVSRIDAVELAIKKATIDLKDCVLASDGFFPFRDNIDAIAKTGIKVIIQPGGSIKDAEVIEACNEYGIAMLFTGIRSFNH